MSRPTSGIHHVTAIARDPQRNVDFYAGTLGMRFIKHTVNYDDPGTLHLYYADERATPGSVLTFFPWTNAAPGRSGRHMTLATAFRAPAGLLERWRRALAESDAEVGEETTRFGRRVLPVTDHDGLSLELVEDDTPEHANASLALDRITGVTLGSARPDETMALLENVLGLTHTGEDAGRTRFTMANGDTIDVVDATDQDRGRMGAGVVHHVALRAADDEQLERRSALVDHGLHVSEVMERTYFRSIYFREPGGVIFEIATDGPGFTVDEPMESLGERLTLPTWLESRRSEITARLPEVRIPPRR